MAGTGRAAANLIELAPAHTMYVCTSQLPPVFGSVLALGQTGLHSVAPGGAGGFSPVQTGTD